MSDLPDLDYQSLAINVIAQAIEDVTCTHNPRMNSRPTDEEIRDAYLFLCSNRRPFYDNRAAWCLLAGYEPDELRKRVLKAISEKTEYRISDFTESSE